jgi:hypothetical protein
VVSRCLSAAGVRFLAILFPPRSSAFLTVGLPAHTGPDRDGVSAFRTHELRPGWVPSITRGQVVLTRPGRLPDRHLPLPSGQSLNPATTSHQAKLSFTGHQQGFTHVHPSGLPLAHAPGMEPAALRLPPELRTSPLQATHVRGRDRPSSTDLELPLNSHPSISNPVVHSMRATSRRTANLRCAPTPGPETRFHVRTCTNERGAMAGCVWKRQRRDFARRRRTQTGS